MQAGPTMDAATEDPGKKKSGIRFRAVLTGFLFSIPVSYACTNAHHSAIFSLMVAPISALLLIIILNIPLRILVPKQAYTQGDLIVCFTILSIVGALSGEFALITHPMTFSYPFHMRTDPMYKDILAKQIPDWLALKDLNQVKAMEGGGKGWEYVVQNLPLFLPRWIMFGTLMISALFALQCINSLMRNAWCERERLTFPLIQLPVAMSEGGGSGGMWKSRAMWIAFIVMFSIDILNGLNFLYPNLPSIPVKDWFIIDRVLKDPPWSNIGDFRISIYPFMAAIGLFMPSDLLLSFVVFFLMRKATHVVLAANGIPQSTFSGTAISPGPPYFDEQTWGAVLAMFVGTLYFSRAYLKEVWFDIRAGNRSEDGGLTHRWAFIGLIGSTAVCIGYGMVGGLPPHYMLVYVALFFIFSIVLTRIRAQLGPPTHEFAFFGTNSIMHRFLGTNWLTDQQAAWVSQVFLFMNRIYRNHPMPYQLEAMKMGQLNQINQKKLFGLMTVAMVFGLMFAYFFLQVKSARTGELGWNDASVYLNHIVNDRKGPDLIGVMMTIFGFAMVLGLDAIRFKFPGFPLHPAGYVLSMNYGVDYYWFGLLIALFVKNFVQRYYGLKGYDKLRSVALGILLGEYAAETIWMAMALITKQSTYTISFNDRNLGGQ